VRNWFGNESSGHAKEAKLSKSKADTHGHPTSAKAWTAKSVCVHLFMDRISNEHKKLSGAEKTISKYHAALGKVFKDLGDEMKQCEVAALEWNTKPLPDEIQHK
jgi:hypothetical protein